MRVLLDECLPRKLKHDLLGHDVFTVPEMGWASIKNGQLLTLMEPDFDVVITIDGNLRYQQNVKDRDIGLLVLSAPDNTLETLRTLLPEILVALTTVQSGEIARVTVEEGNETKE